MAIDTIKTTAILDGTISSADVDSTVPTIAGTNAFSGSNTFSQRVNVTGGASGRYGPYEDALRVKGNNYSYLEIEGTNSQAGIILNKDGSTGMGIGYSNAGKLKIKPIASIDSTGIGNWKDQNTSGLEMDTDGYVTKPNNPSFAAYINGGNINFSTFSDGDAVIFNSTMFNNGSHYDTTNGKFTAPIAGKYYMEVWLRVDNLGTVASDYYHGQFKKNGSGVISGYTARVITTAHTLNIFNFVTSGIVMDLAANDEVNWAHGDGNSSSTNGGSAYYQSGQCRFQGFLLH